MGVRFFLYVGVGFLWGVQALGGGTLSRVHPVSEVADAPPLRRPPAERGEDAPALPLLSEGGKRMPGEAFMSRRCPKGAFCFPRTSMEIGRRPMLGEAATVDCAMDSMPTGSIVTKSTHTPTLVSMPLHADTSPPPLVPVPPKKASTHSRHSERSHHSHRSHHRRRAHRHHHRHRRHSHHRRVEEKGRREKPPAFSFEVLRAHRYRGALPSKMEAPGDAAERAYALSVPRPPARRGMRPS